MERHPEAGQCACGLREIEAGVDGHQWYWQRHSREGCTLELPNKKCWCGVLRSEHVTGHADTQRPAELGAVTPEQLLFDERCRAVTLSGEDYWAIPRDIYNQLRVAVDSPTRQSAAESELASVKTIFDWFIKKIDAIALDGDKPSDVMKAFQEITSTCKRAAGMARLAVPAAASPTPTESEAAVAVVGTVFDNTAASHETLKRIMIERIAAHSAALTDVLTRITDAWATMDSTNRLKLIEESRLLTKARAALATPEENQDGV